MRSSARMQFLGIHSIVYVLYVDAVSWCVCWRVTDIFLACICAVHTVDPRLCVLRIFCIADRMLFCIDDVYIGYTDTAFGFVLVVGLEC